VGRLIANMIGRNEGTRYLPEVLGHLAPLVDEIIFTDDKSDDNTVEVVRNAGCTVYESIWDRPMFTEHEGKLRQQAWWNLENHAEVGDWILAIDCDEKLYETFPDVTIRSLMGHKGFDVINIQFVHMWSRTHFRVDKLWKPTNSQRLFRFQEDGRYRARRLACGAEPGYVINAIRSGRYLKESGLVMQHLGYVSDEDKQNKHDRYMELDKGEFHNIDHLNSILDPTPSLVEWTLDRRDAGVA
jgi:glycosyltransferase involved in cell wall biosynthesis